jgi:hypothetical protein
MLRVAAGRAGQLNSLAAVAIRKIRISHEFTIVAVTGSVIGITVQGPVTYQACVDICRTSNACEQANGQD